MYVMFESRNLRGEGVAILHAILGKCVPTWNENQS